MKIAVVGLGLIGGSFCRAISTRTAHRCRGYDRDDAVLEQALCCGAIEAAIRPEELGWADLTIVCLYPKAAVDFLKLHAACFAPGSLVCDACGVKGAVVDAVTGPLAACGVTFLGAHPMAGREFSGFAYSLPSLYDGASLILTPTDDTPECAVKAMRALAQELGFGRVVVSTPEEHDRVIAYTSQLAHVVSNAYVKSPSLLKESGFSAGSFLDLTRVAKLNEDMWTSLFLLNRAALLQEVQIILDNLVKYRDALAQNDAPALHALLKDGRERKEESLRRARQRGSGDR